MPASTTLSPSERSMRARMAALTRWAHEDPTATTNRARKAFLDRFLDEVDPDRMLPPAERDRRAEAARKAYFTSLAYKSARARRAKRAAA